MIRISVTDLESFRYWKANEDATLEDLLIRLRHEEPPTPAMEAGRAFAKLMETAPLGDMASTWVDGWQFTFALDADVELPQHREVKTEMVFDTPSGPVTLVAKADGVDGRVVHDQKLTERWDPEKYLDSWQWRAYLLMFDADSFVYDVFEGKYDGRTVTVRDYHRMAFYSYPAMEADVQRAVAELAEAVKRRLPERVTAV